MEGLRAMMKNNKKRLFLAACGIGALLVLAACGGGGQDSPTAREADQGTTTSISWAPQAVAFSANPGARQDVPVTLTTTRALSGASITVVPELRGIVTVNPASIGALQAGQSATVVLTVAPGASESLRLVDGTIRVVVGTSTIAKTLPVKITLVTPEVINGVTVPPEPPADLNNATLAGFDVNANGVRDDVERFVVTSSRSLGEAENAMVIARSYQRILVSSTIAPEDYYREITLVTCSDLRASTTLSSKQIRPSVFSTPERKQAFKNKTQAIPGRSIFPSTECK